jgi:hypothetical protein
MSIKIGSKIVSDSIVFHVDFANRKCFAPNLLNYSSWTTGTGHIASDTTKYGVTNFNMSSTTNENIRVEQSNPFGYAKSVVWKSSSQDDYDNADGGFLTGNAAIDKNKLYRFSVWTKRDAMSTGLTTSGSLYFGVNMYDISTKQFAPSKNSSPTFGLTSSYNSYFHYTPNNNPSTTLNVSPPWLGGINVWTLVVGHVWPVGSTYGVITPGSAIGSLVGNYAHPDSGVWTTNSGKVGNLIGSTILNNSGYTDFIWNYSTVTSQLNAYHYYSTDPSATQSFIYPRIDLVDGLEPSIQDLLIGPEPVKDMSSKMNLIYPFSTTNFDKNERGLVFSGIESEVIGGTLSSTFSVFSVSAWFKPSTQISSTTPGQTLVQFGSPAITQPFVIFLGDTTSNVTNEVISIWGSGKFTSVVSPLVLEAVWQNLTIVWQGSSYNVYLNGVLQSTVAGSTGHATPNLNVNYTALGGRKYATLGVEWGVFFQGIIGSVVVYEKSLTESEVISNYNAMIRKYV